MERQTLQILERMIITSQGDQPEVMSWNEYTHCPKKRNPSRFKLGFYETFRIWNLMKHLVWQCGAYKRDFSYNCFPFLPTGSFSVYLYYSYTLQYVAYEEEGIEKVCFRASTVSDWIAVNHGVRPWLQTVLIHQDCKMRVATDFILGL